MCVIKEKMSSHEKRFNWAVPFNQSQLNMFSVHICVCMCVRGIENVINSQV